MEEHATYYPGERRVRFSLTVSIPADQVGDFAAEMSGDDDDIILAAEKVMRERMADRLWEETLEEELELETERGAVTELRHFADA